MFVVTAIGVGIDTRVSLHETYEGARKQMIELMTYNGYDIRDAEEMCHDCYKGYGVKPQCDVEVQIHKAEVQS
jgi:hypothetical protein